MVVMRSCCCCSMKTGSMLIAVLYMIFTGLILIGLGLMLGYFDSVFKPLVNFVINDIPLNATPAHLQAAEASIMTSVNSTRNILIAGVIMKAFYFLLCLLLFVGASKEQSSFMTPWLVAEFFRQLIFFAAFVFLSWFTSALIFKWKMDGAGTFLGLFCILMLMFIALTFYFWLAVIAAMQEFREKERRITPTIKEPHHHHAAGDPYIVYN